MVKRVIIGFGILNLLAFLLVFKKPYKKQRYKKYDCAIICGYHGLKWVLLYIKKIRLNF